MCMLNPKHDARFEDGEWMITPKEAANLIAQTAWRRARNNPEKMRAFLTAEIENSAFAKVHRAGGAYRVSLKWQLPGCNFYMAHFANAYLKHLREHLEKVDIYCTTTIAED